MFRCNENRTTTNFAAIKIKKTANKVNQESNTNQETKRSLIKSLDFLTSFSAFLLQLFDVILGLLRDLLLFIVFSLKQPMARDGVNLPNHESFDFDFRFDPSS